MCRREFEVVLAVWEEVEVGPNCRPNRHFEDTVSPLHLERPPGLASEGAHEKIPRAQLGRQASLRIVRPFFRSV